MPGQRERFKVVPKEKRSTSRFLARTVAGASPAPIAGFIAPAIPTPAKTPPRGDGWVHEILFEGVRVEAQSEPHRLALYDASGNAMTKRLPRIADAVRRLPVNRIVLDGIVIVQDQDGRSDSAALARDLADGRQDRLVYYAFDLLHLDGFDITEAPLVERKRVLESLLAEAGEGPVAYSAHLDIDGSEMLQRVRAMGLAGIVSKRADAPYRPGRGEDWVSVATASPKSRTTPPAAPPKTKAKTMTSSATGPLLVIDGDSFAHRAYHAVPKTVRRADGKGGGAIVGFANYLIRFWQAEKPRAVLAAWDTLSTPNWRQKLFPAYQSGRVFEPDIIEQLDALPEFVAACGFANAKRAGYEADDFLAAAVRQEEARGGRVIVLSGDRDAFQLASELTTIVHPLRAGEVARIGPAEVRERYGVAPRQVPDFIALRGDPSDRIPGARGMGPKGAATLLAEFPTLEEALAAGRFSSQAENLRLYRRIAAMDPSAPLPDLPDMTPTWGSAAALARDWGLKALAERLAGLG
ncbi:MAG TPA: 5'-3' exonuclease H3TH domain-containing protein [Bauldia sp.]|nr:5'-3' exonuclease H3TH domain-containing protein [Bauldia sp.]